MELARAFPAPDVNALYKILLDMWPAHLPKRRTNGSESERHESLLAEIACQLYLSQFGVLRVPPVLRSPVAAPFGGEMETRQSPFATGRSSPPSTEWSMASSSQQEGLEGDDGQDHAVERLRVYAHLNTVAGAEARGGVSGPLPLETGSDPYQYVWYPPGARGAEEEAAARRRREEARRRRRAEKLGLQEDQSAEPSTPQPPVPYIRSSQAEASQQSSSALPFRTKPQPLGASKRRSRNIRSLDSSRQLLALESILQGTGLACVLEIDRYTCREPGCAHQLQIIIRTPYRMAQANN